MIFNIWPNRGIIISNICTRETNGKLLSYSRPCFTLETKMPLHYMFTSRGFSYAEEIYDTCKKNRRFIIWFILVLIFDIVKLNVLHVPIATVRMSFISKKKGNICTMA